MKCSWCSHEVGAKPERGRYMLVDDLCLDCCSLRWKKIQPYAEFIDFLADSLGIMRKPEK